MRWRKRSKPWRRRGGIEPRSKSGSATNNQIVIAGLDAAIHADSR
jgi:hypothetical protein